MPKVGLKDFLDTVHGKFPNLKRYDETRLFAMLLQAGVEVEFELDADGNTMVSYPDITDEIEGKLKQF
ncbi:MAG TPA: hypothetical protein VII11_01440 [Bacteroidota bacterium]